MFKIRRTKRSNSIFEHFKILTTSKLNNEIYIKGNINCEMIKKMCNNCNCDNYEKCSIVGYMPVGFCCSKCYLYDENHTCLANKRKRTKNIKSGEIEHPIRPISSEIEDGLLKVVVEEKGEEIPIYIDLQKQLDS
jgi:hypothetical protein